MAEKDVRDKAVVVMERWMSKKENITEMEMKKIWRALYYCKSFGCSQLARFPLSSACFALDTPSLRLLTYKYA